MIHIVRPLLTEKSLGLASKGWYTFGVYTQMTKLQIARTVSRQYKVNVTGVRTSIRQGKEHRTGRRQTIIQRPDTKKAYVRLRKGQTIDAFEVTAQTETK